MDKKINIIIDEEDLKRIVFDRIHLLLKRGTTNKLINDWIKEILINSKIIENKVENYLLENNFKELIKESIELHLIKYNLTDLLNIHKNTK